MEKEKKAYHHGDLRVALIESAAEVIQELGPKGLTIREVARRAGVSHGAPYRHFADKDALILAVVERGFQLLNEAMSVARSEAGEGVLEQFAASGEAYFQFATVYPAYYRVMFSGDMLSGSGNESFSHTSTGAFMDIKGYIRDCQAQGIVRKDDEVLQSIAIVSMIHGYVSLLNDNRIHPLVGDKYSSDEIRDYLILAIFQGIAGDMTSG